MTMGWDKLKGGVSGRNLLMQEVKGHIEGLEKLEAQAVPSAYIFISRTIKGLIHDIKLLNASFRSTAAKNHLLDCEGFKVDAQELVD